MRKPIGIVITPAEVQYEGLDAVLDNVQARAGASAVNTTLGVYEEAASGQGRREPPLDVIGQGRLLDRPLWGKRELFLRSYQPSPPSSDVLADFAALPYPTPAVAPANLRVDVVRQVIDASRRRGLGVSVQVSPYTLPALPGGQSAEQEAGGSGSGGRPVRVDGQVAERVLAGHGCLNDPIVRALGRARVRDALDRYPDVDTLYLDWAEYTCYFLEDVFTCFCPHCEARAAARGLDWDRIVRDSRGLWRHLTHLEGSDLARAIQAPREAGARLKEGWPGFGDLLALKAATVADCLADLRGASPLLETRRVRLGLNSFPPPFSYATGARPDVAGRECGELRIKLFTFHWPMIVRWYAESLLAGSPGSGEREAIAAVRALLDLPSRPDEHRRRLADYGMPQPDERHLLTADGLTRKLDEAARLAEGAGASVAAYLHSYRPLEEWRLVLRAALESQAETVWVQRYGYLSDAKLDAVREAAAAG